MGPILRKNAPLPQRTAVAPMLDHPHRSLPVGQQYLAHQGNRERTRRLRQQQRDATNRARRQHHGSTSIVGVDTDGALLLDFQR